LEYIEFVKRGLPKSRARKRWLPFVRSPSPADFRSALLSGVESLQKPLDEGDRRLLAALLCAANLAEKERIAAFDLEVARCAAPVHNSNSLPT
jgi:hypothetical protein